MGILDDTAIFFAVVQQGGFSHAAKHLGMSNGLISRRIAQLESKLGVTLLTRTTRQLNLTAEGEVFWQHAQRINQELDSAVNLIQSSAKQIKGTIRLSAPLYFGRYYLTPILLKFQSDFKDIKIDLNLSNQRLDPLKSRLDLVIRGSGYLEDISLKDSSLQMRTLIREKIGLYASPAYLLNNGKPNDCDDLLKHSIISYPNNSSTSDQEIWTYEKEKIRGSVTVSPRLSINDVESNLLACIAGYGIGKFTELHVKNAQNRKELCPILPQYDWGNYNLYAIYPNQNILPKRTRLLLDFIVAHTHHFDK